MVLAGNEAKHLSSVNHTTKTIHHHHFPWNWLVYIIPSFTNFVPDDLKTQEMCNKAVSIDPWLLHDVPDSLKTQKMCNEALEKAP